MKKLLKGLKIAMGIAVAVVAIALCVWMAYSNKKPSSVTSEQALRDDLGVIVTGPSGEMFFEYSGNPGVATADPADTDGEMHYYISGVWRWNDEIECYPGLRVGETKIKLRFNSVKTSETYLKFTLHEGNSFNLNYSSKGGYGNRYGWSDPTNQLIDCGDDPQAVSRELYEYILANAAPATREEYQAAVDQYLWECKVKEETYTISGYWKWNDTFVYTTSQKLVEWKMAGRFANGKDFFGFWFGQTSGSDFMMYSATGGAPSTEIWNADKGGWLSAGFVYINLGEDLQTLSGDDYYFFIANATPITKEEFDAAVKAWETGRPINS